MDEAFATIIAAVLGAFAAAGIVTIRNRAVERKAEMVHDVEVAAFLDGIPSVPGVTPGAQSAAMRMEKVEHGLSDVAVGQALLEKRMDEANGTGRRTEQMVRAIYDHLGMATG